MFHIKPYIPRLVFWELTEKCNLRCIHCRASVSDEFSSEELSTEEIKKTIDNLSAFGKPVLVLTGGEPLYRKDIFDIIDYGVNKGFPVALATNGTLIDKEMADKIVKSGIRRVSISIDGAYEKTHDEFRGISGSFSDAMNGLNNLKTLGMSIQLNTTITRNNINELEDIYKLALKKQADALHIFLLVPVGCGVEINKEQQITPGEYEDILNWFYEKSQEGMIELKATCAPHYARIAAQKKTFTAQSPITQHTSIVNRQSPIANNHPSHITHHPSPGKGCLVGSGIIFISSKGEVRPCGYLPVSAGNIRIADIKDIWEESNIFQELRNLNNLKGKCGICEFKHICMGCRARAYGERGDYMEEEPFCSYIPGQKEK